MPSDFTLKAYNLLIDALLVHGYTFYRFDDFLQKEPGIAVILRHDVDARPENSLAFAKIQHQSGIKGSYYFNANPSAREAGIIKQIHTLGHETGYHYETMDSCNGDYEKAWDEFRYNLDTIRKLVPVTTISMHGSPRSRFDNRALWDRYDYRTLGILGEPYFDIDYSKAAYLTDTGRRWNGSSVSVRDKVASGFVFKFSSTFDIIRGIDSLPDKILFTFHPQRWSDDVFPWINEYLIQNIKNIAKYYIVKHMNR